MKYKYLMFFRKTRILRGVLMALMALLLTNCNEFAKSELAQSVQSFNDDYLPQQQAEGIEWTSLTYDKVLDQVVYKYTIDEDYFDAEETLTEFEENKDEIKEKMIPYVIKGRNLFDMEGTSEKFVYTFTRTTKTFIILFSAEEIEQLIK